MSVLEYTVIPEIITPMKASEILGKVKYHINLFRPIPATKLKMNRPYQILDKKDLRKCFPELLTLAESLHTTVEKFAGIPLELMDDEIRSIRLHRYVGTDEGLLWHIDGAYYTALLTLENSNHSGFEIFTLKQSRFLAFLVYPLYFWQSFFSFFNPKRVVVNSGDLVIMYGGKVVHRTFNDVAQGERIILAVSFNPVSYNERSLRSFLLRWLNVTVRLVSKNRTD